MQEKKTSKGTSYAIIKFSDLSNVFELFIFSDIFEINRENLIEGKSLMLTLIKNYSDEKKTQKRINVKKIVPLNEVINQKIDNLTLKFNSINQVHKLNNLEKESGQTSIKVILETKKEIYTFKLKDKRKVNNTLLNSHNLSENIIID